MLPRFKIEAHTLQKNYVTQTRNSKGWEGGGVAKRPQLKFWNLNQNRTKTKTKNVICIFRVIYYEAWLWRQSRATRSLHPFSKGRAVAQELLAAQFKTQKFLFCGMWRHFSKMPSIIRTFAESSYVMALFLWPESSYKSPNCIHKSPNSPNSGHAIYYVVIGGYPPIRT